LQNDSTEKVLIVYIVEIDTWKSQTLTTIFIALLKEASSVLLKNDRSFVTTEAQIMRWAALIK